MRAPITLSIVHRNKAWWIRGYCDGDCGPFDSKTDCQETLDRLERFEKYQHKKGYVTSDK